MNMLTSWGEKLNKKLPLKEYPRPQLQRDNFVNLNGIWHYQITEKRQRYGDEWKRICVPFPLGSVLSGTEELLGPDKALWYFKSFKYERTQSRTILHFEAVDQCCEVYLNKTRLGIHEGGYLPFEFDVTDVISEQNELILRVTDECNRSEYGYGKQQLEPKDNWHTPFSGIWGTVWLEETGEHYIHDLKITPYFDEKQVLFQIEGEFEQAIVTIVAEHKIVAKVMTIDKQLTHTFKSFHPWSPDDPYLYEVYIQTEDDMVKSYFGMRKFSRDVDVQGKVRFFLNNEPLFLSGLLDQGYWSDGLVTCPDDKCMVHELKTVKAMGFNMLRKHVKIESRRWYYHCDRLGILVMQDMVNGFGPYDFSLITKGKLGMKMSDDKYEKFHTDDVRKRNNFMREVDQTVLSLYNVVSIFAWVPFNEGWGQFDAAKMAERVSYMDSSRLVDHASGWFDQNAGDFYSRHVYSTYKHKNDTYGRIELLSEFGGYMYPCTGHIFTNKPTGIKRFDNQLRFEKAMDELYKEQILPAVEKGLSGCIYCQLSDVENECNGLFTYDRKVLKIDANGMRRLNEKLMKSIK